MGKKSDSIATFFIGNFSLTTVLIIIFGLIGAIIGGWAGLGVGIVMPLGAGLIAIVGLVPFVGAFIFYPQVFNWFFDWLNSAVPSMHSFLGQGEVPRVALFWIFGICAGIATIVVSAVVIVIIAIVIGAIISGLR